VTPLRNPLLQLLARKNLRMYRVTQ
jgi:hypothetical protein